MPDYAKILKGNPYHDATGAFTSKDKAVGGGGGGKGGGGGEAPGKHHATPDYQYQRYKDKPSGTVVYEGEHGKITTSTMSNPLSSRGEKVLAFNATDKGGGYIGQYTSAGSAANFLSNGKIQSDQFNKELEAKDKAKETPTESAASVTSPAPPATPLGGPFRSKIVPTKENEEARGQLQTYMDGYSGKLKNEQERAYVQERVRQMINGETRPKGMSGKFGLEKARAIQYEALTYKIFQSGRKKIGL